MSILNEINEIMALAIEMCAQERANVFVHYSGHVNNVHVYAHPFDQLYQGEERTMLVDKIITLADQDEALEELKTLRQQIEQLAVPVPEVTESSDDLLAAAFEYRNEMSLTGGVVVVYDGQVSGWMHKLERPEAWAPGCIAIDDGGNRWVSEGGNDQDGAKRWVAEQAVAIPDSEFVQLTEEMIQQQTEYTGVEADGKPGEWVWETDEVYMTANEVGIQSLNWPDEDSDGCKIDWVGGSERPKLLAVLKRLNELNGGSEA